MTATIRVRVNPGDNGEYVIYADAEDCRQHWLGQRTGGRWTGWNGMPMSWTGPRSS